MTDQTASRRTFDEVMAPVCPSPARFAPLPIVANARLARAFGDAAGGAH